MATSVRFSPAHQAMTAAPKGFGLVVRNAIMQITGTRICVRLPPSDINRSPNGAKAM